MGEEWRGKQREGAVFSVASAASPPRWLRRRYSPPQTNAAARQRGMAAGLGKLGKLAVWRWGAEARGGGDLGSPGLGRSLVLRCATPRSCCGVVWWCRAGAWRARRGRGARGWARRVIPRPLSRGSRGGAASVVL